MMRDDIIKLRDYMMGHHERLNNDIQNALKKDDEKLTYFYDGAQNATNLFINLLNDIINKPVFHEGICPNCGEDNPSKFQINETDERAEYWGCISCGVCVNDYHDGDFEVIKDCL